jgi:hypothetical protein
MSGHSRIRLALLNAATQDRRCEICKVNLTGRDLGDLCERHRTRRGKYGSPHLRGVGVLRHDPRGGKSRCEWKAILPLAVAFLKKHPPSAETVAALAHVLEPGNPPSRHISKRHPRAVLYRELSWFQDPRSHKKPPGPPRGFFKVRHAPKPILAALISVTIYIEERDGRGFPHDAADVALGFALASHWHRPKSPSGHSVPLRGTTRRLLAQRIRSALGVYLLTSARAIIAQRQRDEAAKATKPQMPQLPPTKLYQPERKPTLAEQMIRQHVDSIQM